MINEIQSIMTQNLFILMLIVFLSALVLTAVLTSIMIPILKKHKAKQIIHEDVPENHQAKAGTPTMGGIAIVAGVIITCLCVALYLGNTSMDLVITLSAFFVFALLGFLDDYYKIINKRNLGLTAKQKILIQCFIALYLAIMFVVFEGMDTNIYVPFTEISFDLGSFYIPFMAFAIIAMVNSVNLTDGLDGLASGVSLIVCLFFTMASITYSVFSANWFFLALAGACVGFLIFNKNPAKIFMGDTGSLAIGGGIAMAAFYSDLELIMIIAGFVYVAEALSDIIQVVSYKYRNGKRVFKMAPLHHHFELNGWNEKKIVAIFMLCTLILCAICSFSV